MPYGYDAPRHLSAFAKRVLALFSSAVAPTHRLADFRYGDLSGAGLPGSGVASGVEQGESSATCSVALWRSSRDCCPSHGASRLSLACPRHPLRAGTDLHRERVAAGAGSVRPTAPSTRATPSSSRTRATCLPARPLRRRVVSPCPYPWMSKGIGPIPACSSARLCDALPSVSARQRACSGAAARSASMGRPDRRLCNPGRL